MRRREFIASIAAAIVWPLRADAQQGGRMPRIGILSIGVAGPSASSSGPLYERLHELGYTEERNILFERRYAGWQFDRLPQLAAELAALDVDVIVAVATPAARAAKHATRTIPIVAVSMGDPVGDELVASLRSPGGNLTGTTFLGPELVAKRFGLLKQAIPAVARVAALWHPGAYGELTMQGFLNEAETAARILGIEVQLVQATDPADIEHAFSAISVPHTDALICCRAPCCSRNTDASWSWQGRAASRQCTKQENSSTQAVSCHTGQTFRISPDVLRGMWTRSSKAPNRVSCRSSSRPNSSSS
jgi:putative tryptophan/tyrosine transport system substrate-binding protein